MIDTGPSLSIVMPIHNEECRLPGAIGKMHSFKLHSYPDFELILVENGSTDQTRNMANWYAEKYPWIKFAHTTQRGKGLAVRMGVQLARGEFVYMADCDLSTGVGEIQKFIASMQDAQIVIGNRGQQATHRRTFTRRVMSLAFHGLTGALVPGIHDTQCGFKMFEARAAREIFQWVQITGMAFDVEVLYLARALGYTVKEIPVRWVDVSGSQVRLGADSAQMLRDILSIPVLHRARP